MDCRLSCWFWDFYWGKNLIFCVVLLFVLFDLGGYYAL